MYVPIVAIVLAQETWASGMGLCSCENKFPTPEVAIVIKARENALAPNERFDWLGYLVLLASGINDRAGMGSEHTVTVARDTTIYAQARTND